MNITFRQLKIFEAVVRQLSFTRAAAELRLTQPAVSMQITQREQEAGMSLLEQLGKRIQLKWGRRLSPLLICALPMRNSGSSR